MKGKFDVRKIVKWTSITVVCALATGISSAVVTGKGISMRFGNGVNVGYVNHHNVNYDIEENINSTIENALDNTENIIESSVGNIDNIMDNVDETLDNIDDIMDNVDDIDSSSSNWNISVLGKMKKFKVDETEEHEISNIDNMYIKTVSTDINIIAASDNKVKAHFYGEISTNNEKIKPHLEVNDSGKKLNIIIEYPKVLNLSINSNAKLDVYIPEKYINDISLSTVSGDVYIDKLKVDEFEYKTTSGSTKIEDLTCKESEFRSVSGDVKIKSLVSEESDFNTTSGEVYIDSFAGELEGGSVSGSFNVNYKEFNNDIDIHTTSGDVELKFPKNAEFNLNFKTVSGDFSNAFPMKIIGKESSRNIEGTVGEADNTIRIKTVSGDVEINN